jgi:hypothetical protein
MPLKSEGNYLGDLVKYEEPLQKYSRETVTVISGQNLTLGTVVGKITASGKVTILAPAAVDGSQNAYGVLIEDVDASAADKLSTVIRREAVLADSKIVYPGGITAPQKATALSQLEAVGITVRTAE